ncbi:hypothetical protein vBYenM636_38 [Yersinia phage vB_YenM_636]|nr:hypothetical protein X1_19 [Yersinia phage vB_Yen_X1]QKN86289.1 hypothetical protein vBYenM12_38 [Yersinia phage vB_YenM_12]QKN86380.1 hypothetical protein vBYenM22_38 [Yersinia phage vB_YenM_22]QKN86471.1 hypothetical protein vBYenM25_38 [Yersinia phage vB_YenM_25]QKN86562.1 hypothetical protein vBYenM27_38 [Yersinia phage vB_YenM_27]QKN86653.1 hypothetical protein vBYenM39_38 [Yersinia phage vB_YenM_39]QKN86744.1 hypothetical protein vBYenM126_38 [Yersinia phage vB_YenM_126]QKN86835.1 h
MIERLKPEICEDDYGFTYVGMKPDDRGWFVHYESLMKMRRAYLDLAKEFNAVVQMHDLPTDELVKFKKAMEDVALDRIQKNKKPKWSAR